jgi:methionyl-tRNA formyltransferase
VAIDDDESLDELRSRLVTIGTDLLVATLHDGLGEPEPQQGEVTYANKIDPGELHLDWTEPAVALHRRVRLGNAWPTLRGQRRKVWRTTVQRERSALAPGEIDGRRVGTGEGTLELIEVQPEGKGRVDAAAWRNGARPEPGEKLGS